MDENVSDKYIFEIHHTCSEYFLTEYGKHKEEPQQELSGRVYAKSYTDKRYGVVADCCYF